MGCQVALLLLVLTSCVDSRHARSPQTQYLYRAAQEGGSASDPGIWGGSVDHTGDGASQDLYTYGLPLPSPVLNTQEEIVSLVHDPATNWAYLLIVNSNDHSTSLMTGPLCASREDQYHSLLRRVELVSAQDPYLLDRSCGWRCGMGPLVVSKAQVYFVFTGLYGSLHSLSRRIEIRRMAGCGGQLTLQASRFDIVNCSKVIHTVHEAPYEILSPKMEVWSTDGLAVFTEQHGYVQFFTQLVENQAGSDAKILLVQLAPYTAPSTLFSSVLGAVYGSSKVVGLGSVSLRRGNLCWTAGDSLRCSTYSGGRWHSPTVLLSGSEAVSAGICKGVLANEDLLNTLTGVAIADSHRTLAIYFSCYAEHPNTGGVGLVRWSHHGLVRDAYTVTSEGQHVYGGQMFVADQLDQTLCEGESPPAPPLTPHSPTRDPPPPSYIPDEGENCGTLPCHPDVFTEGTCQHPPCKPDFRPPHPHTGAATSCHGRTLTLLMISQTLLIYIYLTL